MLISIHALREEGDHGHAHEELYLIISIHALREEGDLLPTCGRLLPPAISIHALREEGDLRVVLHNVQALRFLSTPSARRATICFLSYMDTLIFLSTPSARRATDGRDAKSPRRENFYPRPPRGGRPTASS